MSTKRIFLLVATMAIALAIWFWARAETSFRHRCATLASLAQNRVVLEEDIRALERQLASVASTTTIVQQTSQTAPTELPKASAALRNEHKSAAPRSTLFYVTQDPAAEKAYLRWQQTVAAEIYTPYLLKQGFSPQQIEKILEIHVRETEQGMDIVGALGARYDVESSTAKALREQAKAESAAALIRLMGDQGYQKFISFQQQEPYRNVIASIAGTAALEGVPLTPQQGEQLTEILLRATQGKMPAQDYLAAADWTTIDAQARSVLSPAQYRLFTSVAPPTGFGSRFAPQLEGALARALRAKQEKSP